MKLSKNVFGLLAATCVSGALSTMVLAEEGATKAGATAKAPKCVHNCSGYAECKGNGSNSCKGKNDCANQGLVPKACSSQKDEASCKKVTDKKKQTMCTWYNS